MGAQSHPQMGKKSKEDKGKGEDHYRKDRLTFEGNTPITTQHNTKYHCIVIKQQPKIPRKKDTQNKKILFPAHLEPLDGSFSVLQLQVHLFGHIF